MALLEEVAAQLRKVMGQADQLTGVLRAAAEFASDAVGQVDSAGRGSAQEHEFTQAVDQWTEVVDGASDLIGVVASARAHVERILQTLMGEGTPRSSSTLAPVPEPEKPWADRQRARLPKYVTSGVYVDPDGNTEIVQSGQEQDGEHQRIAVHLRRLGFPVNNRGRVTASEHVEGKVAWRQRDSGVEHVELVVNNEMCQGMYSCRKLVPFILRPGQTLVVHDPVTSRTFHGRSPL